MKEVLIPEPLPSNNAGAYGLAHFVDWIVSTAPWFTSTARGLRSGLRVIGALEAGEKRLAVAIAESEQNPAPVWIAGHVYRFDDADLEKILEFAREPTVVRAQTGEVVAVPYPFQPAFPLVRFIDALEAAEPEQPGKISE